VGGVSLRLYSEGALVGPLTHTWSPNTVCSRRGGVLYCEDGGHARRMSNREGIQLSACRSGGTAPKHATTSAVCSLVVMQALQFQQEALPLPT
jgi:hypothetical protein